MSVKQDRRDEIWAVWRRLVKEFGFRRMMAHLSVSKSGLGLYDVDLVTSLERTPMARGAIPLLQPMSDDELEVLHGLARINAERNNAIWKMAAVFYVTVPTTLILASFQIVPGIVRRILSEHSLIWLGLFTLISLSLLYCFSIYWRASQVQAVIELEQVQRKLEA